MLLEIKNNLKKRNFQALSLFALSLLIFNVAFISSHGWVRVIWSYLGYLALFIACRIEGLSLGSIGLSRSRIKQGLKYGIYIIAVILLFMLLVFFIDKNIYEDPRYHQKLGTALIAALVLVPLKTVLFEEVTFRGILPAIALRIKNQQRFATIVSSVAFGLWHVFSASKIGDYDLAGAVTIPNIVVILGVFIATTAAGFLFCELRWRSGSLLAPIIVHWFINGCGIVLASLSWS
jgi:membrane protease YdiL (CAAX protease family)